MILLHKRCFIFPKFRNLLLASRSRLFSWGSRLRLPRFLRAWLRLCDFQRIRLWLRGLQIAQRHLESLIAWLWLWLGNQGLALALALAFSVAKMGAKCQIWHFANSLGTWQNYFGTWQLLVFQESQFGACQNRSDCPKVTPF